MCNQLTFPAKVFFCHNLSKLANWEKKIAVFKLDFTEYDCKMIWALLPDASKRGIESVAEEKGQLPNIFDKFFKTFPELRLVPLDLHEELPVSLGVAV